MCSAIAHGAQVQMLHNHSLIKIEHIFDSFDSFERVMLPTIGIQRLVPPVRIMNADEIKQL